VAKTRVEAIARSPKRPKEKDESLVLSVPLGSKTIQLFADITEHTDDTVSMEMGLELSQDGGASWQSWGSARRDKGGPPRKLKDGITDATEAGFTIDLPGETNPDRRVRCYILVEGKALPTKIDLVFDDEKRIHVGRGTEPHSLATVVNVGVQGSGPVSSVTTASFDSTGSDLLLAAYSRYATTAAATPISDSKSNTWTAALAEQHTSGTNGATRQFYVASPTVGTGHTVTFTLTGADFPTVTATGVSGAALASPLDKTGTGQDSTSPHNSGTTGTLSQAAEYIYGTCCGTGDSFPEGYNGNTAGFATTFSSDSTASLMGICANAQIVASTAALTSAVLTDIGVATANVVSTYLEAAAGGASPVFEFRVPSFA